MARRTLLRVLLEERGCHGYAVFDAEFGRAAEAAARDLGRPGLAAVSASQATWKRWLSGEQVPRADTATVLEHWLGADVAALLRPAADERDGPRPRTGAEVVRDTARALDDAFGGSSLRLPDAASGLEGLWHLTGRHRFDGAQLPVQIYEADEHAGLVIIGAADQPHVRHFIRPTRRALILAESQGSAYALDAAYAKRSLVTGGDMLTIPSAYRVDQLTYALLWAMTNLDDSLQADDAVLHAEQQRLGPFLEQRRSAMARAAMPELTNVSAAWLGMHVCARHITRQLAGTSAPPLFWTPLPSAEDAAAWLFFACWPEYLSAIRDGAGAAPSERALYIPEAVLRDAGPHERVLLWLAVALMELHGLEVRVYADPGFARTDAFVLVPDDKVIVTNWMAEHGIWHVDTSDSLADVRACTELLARARARAVTHGASPEDRLRSLAGHLDVDWEWLTRRCGELATFGTGGLLRPRSRLVDTASLDAVLAFAGKLGGSAPPGGAPAETGTTLKRPWAEVAPNAPEAAG
ncbi:hypothetical protein [Streptomyces sp. NPDC102360]|uniref:hypothetical protein n=1 Tax=Streptomyces sp. NPDC102360 TaxID=3366160 RepID=UPI003830AEB1